MEVSSSYYIHVSHESLVGESVVWSCHVAQSEQRLDSRLLLAEL